MPILEAAKEYSLQLRWKSLQEIGLALEKARKQVKRGNTIESVAAAYGISRILTGTV